MDDWIVNSLSNLLNFPVTDEMIGLIHEMPNDRDLDNYMESLLDLSNPSHRIFLTELKKKRAQDTVLTGYRKLNDNNNDLSTTKQQKEKKKNKVKDPSEVPSQSNREKVDKSIVKKQKFVNLYADGRKNILLKGRKKCDCEAKLHDLINNCLNCGRIVCIQEGSGPCFHCNELVCTIEEQAIMNGGKKKHSDTLYNKLMDQKMDYNPLKQRDKLLEYDRNSTKRTQVIDDECDYYTMSNNNWLSKNERHEMSQHEILLTESKHGSRLNKGMKINLEGQIVNEDNENIVKNQETKMMMMLLMDSNKKIQGTSADLVCPRSEFARPEYISRGVMTHACPGLASDHTHRVQDKGILEMMDEGFCLTLHQPYASLLVSGIKIHEGRTWYSSHRGRLWIHAASRAPVTEEVATIEHSYKVLLNNEGINFPQTYNTSCLIGFVTIVDVLSQDEYRKKFPGGESQCPFVFICADPQQVPLQIPMQGKHKIYKMDKKIQRCALGSIEQFSKIKG